MFVFAKTMPHIPHEYVVRTTENEEQYRRLFLAIKNDGVWEKWKKWDNQYLYPGDGYKYWAMTNEYAKSRIINRCKA
jgi:hypothetical protein